MHYICLSSLLFNSFTSPMGLAALSPTLHCPDKRFCLEESGRILILCSPCAVTYPLIACCHLMPSTPVTLCCYLVLLPYVVTSCSYLGLLPQAAALCCCRCAAALCCHLDVVTWHAVAQCCYVACHTGSTAGNRARDNCQAID